MDLLEEVELDRWTRRVTDVIVILIIWNALLTIGIIVLLVLALRY